MNERMKIMALVVFLMTVTVYQVAHATITGPTPTVEKVNAQGIEQNYTEDAVLNEDIFINEDIVVSEDAVRIRIIPHSNAYQDQLAKRMVSFAMDDFLIANEASLGNIDSTRIFIQNNIGQIENRIEQVLEKINYDLGFDVTYGAHLFPEKHHNGEVFPAGYYESLVIRIGEGRGNNWWCFINPGMCLGPNTIEVNDGSDSEHWNTQNQLMENTQDAIRTQNFTSYISGIVESLFGTGTEGSVVQPEAQVANHTNSDVEFDWFLFEDER